MKKLNYYFIIGYMLMLFISSILLILGSFIDIPLFYNLTSIYTTSKVYFLSSLMLAFIGFYVFGKHIKNYSFSVGVTVILGTILYASLSYSLDNLLSVNFLINHIISYLFTSLISFYIGYIFIISKLEFKLQNTFAIVAMLYITCVFSYMSPTYYSNIYLSLNQLENNTINI